MPHNFQKGDRVRGKDHPLRGIVTAILNDGRMMVLDEESEMELPEDPKAWVKEEILETPSLISAKEVRASKNKSNNDTALIDLHWEKIPRSYHSVNPEKLGCQIGYLKDMLVMHSQTRKITIITGRGQGVLLKRVKELLRGNKRIKTLSEGGKTAFEESDRIFIEWK